jgi:chitodextrinase
MLVRFRDLPAASGALWNREFRITVLSSTTFSLQDALTGADFDGAQVGDVFGAFVERVHEVVTPYGSAQLDGLRMVQVNDQFDSLGILLNSSVAPQVLSVASAPTETAFASFSLAAADFRDGPYLDAFENSYVTPSALAGVVALELSFASYDSAKAYAAGDFVTDSGVHYQSLVAANQGKTPASYPAYWGAVAATTVVNNGRGFLSSDIGRHVRLHSEPPLWDAATTYAAGNPVTYNGVYYKSLVGSNTGNQPGLDATKWSVDPSAHRWTWGKIVSLSLGSLVMVERSVGSAIGNLTSGGGLAAAFDGTTSQGYAASAHNHTSTSDAYIGKDYGANAFIPALARVWATNDVGLKNGSNLPIYTAINVRGSNTAPSSPSDGTLIGAYGVLANDIPNGTYLDIPCFGATAYRYIWVEFSPSVYEGVRQPTGVAELQFFQLSGAASDNVGVQILGEALLYTSAVRTWRLGLYSDTTGWPRCGVGHEGRLWLAGVMANRIDFSRSNKPFVFSPTETDGSVTGSCGGSYIFNTKDRNDIFWMESGQQGILCGTQGGEWMVQATQSSEPLTPTSIQAHRRTFVKCANVEPVRTKNTYVLVQELRRKLIEYFPEVSSGNFCAPDLSWGAKQMTEGKIKQIAFQQEPSPVVWMVTQDGQLRGMTYQRDSLISAKEAELKGWHRHVHGGGRMIESISVGPSDDDLETLFAVTRDVAGQYHVEMLQPVVSEDIDLKSGWYLDGAMRAGYLLVSPTEVAFHGLYPLVGQTVSVFYGGLDLGEHVVSTTGSVTIAFASAAAVAAGLTLEYALSLGPSADTLFGFKYASQGQILPPIDPREAGAQNGPGFGKTQRAHQIAILLESCRGLEIGTDFDHMRDAQLSTSGGRRLGSTDLFSGMHHDTLGGEYTLGTRLCWQITGPFPGTVLAIGGFLYTADR